MFDHPVHFCFYNCAIAYTQHKPDFTQESTTDPSVYHKHNIYPLFWFQIKHCYWKYFFIVILFFFYSNTIFIDVFKCNKYKKHIIQCFLLLHLLLDLYIKLLKQVAKHLNYFSYVITNILN